MDLLTRLLDLRQREHLCTVDLLEALVECANTRAYLDHGYESLWSFLIGAMRYSNAAASRRNKALKCARKFPVVLAWLRAERVTLCSLEAIAPLLDEFDSEQELLDRIDGKSQAEVQAIVAQARPAAERRESVRREFVEKKVAAPTALFATQSEDSATEQGLPSESALSVSSPLESERPVPWPPASSPVPPPPPPPPVEERVRVTLSLTPEEFEVLERARMLASRRPGRVPSVHEIVVETARFYVERKAPKERATKAPKEKAAKPPTDGANHSESSTTSPAPAPASRHVPAATRDAVFLRDGERCTFVSPKGQRCQSKHHLQIDHVVPFALGGTHAPDNLRVLCGAHNRRRAERTFGARSSGAELTLRE